MSRCDHCGKECTLPFTCQHCGGKFCPDCRLPPGHNCTGIASWKKKPLPSVGMNYGSGGGVTATGGGYRESTRTAGKKTAQEIPWLKIMITAIAIILLGVAYLVLSGYPAR
jgi:hypothetical protein